MDSLLCQIYQLEQTLEKVITGAVRVVIKRTPLGGFINHSEDSNCKRVGGPSSFHIITTSEIRAGDELTVTYTWYKP